MESGGTLSTALAAGQLSLVSHPTTARQLSQKADSRLPNSGLVGTPGQLRQVVADYTAVGVDELLVPDFAVSAED